MVFDRVSIVGTSYVGLCTAVAFASKGYTVIASTHNPRKADLTNKGRPPFFEPGLEELLKEAVSQKRFRCVLGRKKAVLSTDITFISVATPSQLDGSINLQFIEKASREIGEALNQKSTYHLVVVKSTVTPGTTQNIVKSILEKYSKKRCGIDFGLCMNPEFLREGSAIHDVLYPDRIVIGEYDKMSGDVLETVYRGFHADSMPPLIRTNLATAEIIKYVNNAFLATKISFINQIARLCEKIPGADITTVAKAIGLDERIGPFFLNAGLGYGGSCLPKDVKALIVFSKSLGNSSTLLKAVQEINNTQPYKAVELAIRLLGHLNRKRIAILGLAFKPNTDDMREAVSIKVINQLLEKGSQVIVYDPKAMNNAKKVFGTSVKYASSAAKCLDKADCCILITEWDEFKKLKPDDFLKYMRTPVLIDGRRIYDSEEYSRKLNFAAIGLG
ncbi:MAG: UDP-glucose dehydrogenase family protein [bacterium]